MAQRSRESILGKIKKALENTIPEPFPGTRAEGIFPPAGQELEVAFAEAFTRLQGNFSFCVNPEEMVSQLRLLAEHKKWDKWFCNQPVLKRLLTQHGWPFLWHQELANCQASITFCEALIARTGTIVLSSAASGGRTPSVYAPAHVCIAYTSQLVYNIGDGLHLLQEKYKGNLPSSISFASGPSRTADIEKTLVTGVHGPKEVYCFLVEG